MGLFWRIIDTLLLAAGVFYILVKYGNPFFAKRKKEIETSLEKAREFEKKAKEIYEEAKIKLDEVKQEIEDIKKEAVKESEIEKNHIIEDARTSAGKILENYVKQAKSEIDNQKRLLFEEALNMSFKVMQDIMQKEMTPEAYNKINDSFLKLQEEAFAKQSNK
ncbi:MAG: F0F1 ATP synthase subunit B family protein [bacterium]